MNFGQACKHEWMKIEFEYTARDTPQQNGHVEWKVATLFNKVLAMLNSGKFSAFLNHGLWAEVTNTATLLEREREYYDFGAKSW